MILEGTEVKSLWGLASAYEACKLSACDPISVPSGIRDSERKHAYSRIFYDCTTPDEKGIDIMKKRIEEAGDDINYHLSIHETLLKNFYFIDEALKAGDRERIVESGSHVFKNLEYYGNSVRKHLDKFGERAFLNYPTCLPGHFFAPRYTGIIMEKFLNLEQNEEGFVRDIGSGLATLRDFPLQGEGFGEIRMYDGRHDSGSGIIGTSLRSRLELTKELLKRAGFFSGMVTNPEGEMHI